MARATTYKEALAVNFPYCEEWDADSLRREFSTAGAEGKQRERDYDAQDSE